MEPSIVLEVYRCPQRCHSKWKPSYTSADSWEKSDYRNSLRQPFLDDPKDHVIQLQSNEINSHHIFWQFLVQGIFCIELFYFLKEFILLLKSEHLCVQKWYPWRSIMGLNVLPKLDTLYFYKSTWLCPILMHRIKMRFYTWKCIKSSDNATCNGSDIQKCEIVSFLGVLSREAAILRPLHFWLPLLRRLLSQVGNCFPK